MSTDPALQLVLSSLQADTLPCLHAVDVKTISVGCAGQLA